MTQFPESDAFGSREKDLITGEPTTTCQWDRSELGQKKKIDTGRVASRDSLRFFYARCLRGKKRNTSSPEPRKTDITN